MSTCSSDLNFAFSVTIEYTSGDTTSLRLDPSAVTIYYLGITKVTFDFCSTEGGDDDYCGEGEQLCVTITCFELWASD